MTAILALLMIDVDHFKLFNDTYGHLEGDARLTRLGEALSGIAADTMGFAARHGGEEFCLLLPNTDVAPRRRDRRAGARSAVLRLCLPRITSEPYRSSTVSIGASAARPNELLASRRSDRRPPTPPSMPPSTAAATRSSSTALVQAGEGEAEMGDGV